MNCLYMVRCNFSDPEREAAWNRWYNGPKQDWLLTRPGFFAGQRFQAEWVTDAVSFLAVYLVESPDVFSTPEYRSGWGFAEWTEHIIDWSRNLFQGGLAGDFLAADDQRLHVVMVTEKAAPDAGDQADRLRPGLSWRPATGLDRSVSRVGMRLQPAGRERPASPLPDGVVEGVYTPISPARRAQQEGAS